jgi:hypothetical protein
MASIPGVTMASIEVIIRDDQGNIISEGNVKEIALRHANLETIEAGVEAWRKQALPEIEAQLLQQAQREFTLEKKRVRVALQWHSHRYAQNLAWEI